MAKMKQLQVDIAESCKGCYDTALDDKESEMSFEESFVKDLDMVFDGILTELNLK